MFGNATLFDLGTKAGAIGMNLISNKELIEMGYRPHTANDIIHQARELLVSRGYTFYNRKRLMVVPKSVVNEILGTEVA